MWYYVLGSFTVCNATVPNVTISWHGATVTISQSPIPNAGTSAKAYTIGHDNICGTKYNNNDWSYPGIRAKYGTIVVTVLLLWSYPGNGTKCVSR